ncbi:hypothetical protein CFC21_095490 [Triticum aestivum]|uniref:Glutamine cyclotransferase n=2 Tax=Triticum aestivum TaxID=4565 RepID=A0A3B6R7P8_WHEAT|nr:hypothetical protein CFC21_095490 [Triticum aestivum]
MPPLLVRHPVLIFIIPTMLLTLLGLPPTATLATRFYSFDLMREYPHDPEAFTEGLLYGGNDTLFESTGLFGRSSVRKVDLQTGKCGSFSHKMRDGWGLATDGKVVFGSDGTSTLYQIDPESHQVMRMVPVKYQDNDVRYLNELEYINGEVWANVFKTDCIAIISPDSGIVVGWVFLHELRHHSLNSGNMAHDVLNGIAWDEDNRRLFVTGKLWPTLYEIKLRHIEGPPDGSIEKLCPRIIIPGSGNFPKQAGWSVTR